MDAKLNPVAGFLLEVRIADIERFAAAVRSLREQFVDRRRALIV